MATDPTARVVETGETTQTRTLLLGVSTIGLAGVTAVDHLVTTGDAERIAHLEYEGVPTITPFADGAPRHHTRLYSLEDDVTALIGEQFVPVPIAETFVDGIYDWIHARGVEEILLLYGVPYPHGPDEHRPFAVATDDYRRRRLEGSGIEGLSGGVLDGVAGELLRRGLDQDAPPTGVLVTPAHPPGPDIDAALMLLSALGEVHDLSVDDSELRRRSEEVKRYYAEMAETMQAMGEREGRSTGRDFPEDRMFM